MNTVTGIALAGLVVAGALCFARLVRGPSLPERIVALDTLVVMIVSGIAVHAVRTGSGIYLDVLVVVALLGFVSTLTVARFIEGKGT